MSNSIEPVSSKKIAAAIQEHISYHLTETTLSFALKEYELPKINHDQRRALLDLYEAHAPNFGQDTVASSAALKRFEKHVEKEATPDHTDILRQIKRAGDLGSFSDFGGKAHCDEIKKVFGRLMDQWTQKAADFAAEQIPLIQARDLSVGTSAKRTSVRPR